MTVARFPSLAHWGAFTALVENGRVIGCEPFARDPAPSNMIAAIPPSRMSAVVAGNRQFMVSACSAKVSAVTNQTGTGVVPPRETNAGCMEKSLEAALLARG